MANQLFQDVELTPYFLEQVELRQGYENRWDIFTLPDSLPSFKKFASNGGPDLGDLRFDHTDPDSRSHQRSAPKAKYPLSPSHDGYEEELRRYNILMPGFRTVDVPPLARDISRTMSFVKDLYNSAMREISYERKELSFFAQFRRLAAKPTVEQVWRIVWNYLELGTFIDGDTFQSDQWLQFHEDCSMAPNLILPLKPTFCEGARRSLLDADIREELGFEVSPTSNNEGLIAPNFFIEVQTTRERPYDLAKKASALGAYGARAICRLQAHLNEGTPIQDERVAFTATFEDCNLKIYAHHVHFPRNVGERRLYRTELLCSISVDSNLEELEKGARMLWAVRKLAHEKRMAAIEGANKRHRGEDDADSASNQGPNGNADSTSNQRPGGNVDSTTNQGSGGTEGDGDDSEP